MSGFSADWLALREPADRRARCSTLLAGLPRQFPAIVDLGAGSGSNLRWLAPRLAGSQAWSLVDNDASLLAAARIAIRRQAETAGCRVAAADDALVVTNAKSELRIRTVELDLATGLATLDLPEGCLVTGSALLDLVSRQWLEQLVRRVAQRHACVLFALSYDGTVRFRPRCDGDALVVSLVNRHQLTNKGFGPALGPEAWRVAHDLLHQHGFAVAETATPWRLGPGDAALMEPLIDGWAEAAAAVDPASRDALADWRQRRLAELADGGLEICVGHRDVAAWPRGD